MRYTTFDGALREVGAAKETLRIATLGHVSNKNKASEVARILKATPGCVRFDETKAAVWLLT